jgi:SAM-dependent methyltransferase
MPNSSEMRYPFLQQFSAEIGIPEENLVAAFEIESVFHRDILITSDAATRRKMYAEVYARVHPLLTSDKTSNHRNTQRELVRVFRRELTGKSVLDVGCGTGDFLFAIRDLLRHRKLCGLDVSIAHLPTSDSVRFVQTDVTEFQLDETFDVVFSSHVFEHIAPQDLSTHLESICRALRENGTLILCLPNRYWGPSDVTRILDNRRCGLTPAQGTHLNESSYSELIPLLKSKGFSRIRTVLPFAHRLPVNGVRIPPVFNLCLEQYVPLRSLLNQVKRHGKPAFQNPIVLIADLASANRVPE